MALRPSRYVRVVASADSFITRMLTIAACGATPMFDPAAMEATLEPRGGVGGVERDFDFMTARGDDVLRMHRRGKGEHEKRDSERARQDHRLFWTSWTTASRMGETRANDKKKF